MQVFILLTTNIFILCQMLSVVSESRLIFLVHATTTQKKRRFFDFVRKNYKKIRRLFFLKKYITLYRTLFKIQERGFAIFTNMATCLRERKRERVSFSLLEREDHVRSVCMFVSLCVCVCVSYVIMLIRKKV